MVFGINNVTNISMENITTIANITKPEDFFINVNHIIFNGWLYFILLLVLWFIMWKGAQMLKEDGLVNLTITGAIITVLAFFMRVVVMLISSSEYGLLTDYQMWIFPLITAISAFFLWITKK